MESMDELAIKVDNLSKRKRNPSKQAGPPKETTSESEAAATSPLGSDHGDDTDPITVQVWDEMFKDKPFHEIAGKSDFLENQVCKLITPQQATRMGAAVIMEIEARKDAFLRIKGGNVTQLRKQLQILFTRIIVKRITIKLEKSKRITGEK